MLGHGERDAVVPQQPARVDLAAASGQPLILVPGVTRPGAARHQRMHLLFSFEAPRVRGPQVAEGCFDHVNNWSKAGPCLILTATPVVPMDSVLIALSSAAAQRGPEEAAWVLWRSPRAECSSAHVY